MHERRIHIRIAILFVGILGMVVWQQLFGGPRHVVQIQYGIEREVLTGAPVWIDGEQVGTLDGPGGRTLVGFYVEEGEHTIEVRVPGMQPQTRTFRTQQGGTHLQLTAMIYSRTGPDGESTYAVVLER